MGVTGRNSQPATLAKHNVRLDTQLGELDGNLASIDAVLLEGVTKDGYRENVGVCTSTRRLPVGRRRSPQNLRGSLEAGF